MKEEGIRQELLKRGSKITLKCPRVDINGLIFPSKEVEIDRGDIRVIDEDGFGNKSSQSFSLKDIDEIIFYKEKWNPRNEWYDYIPWFRFYDRKVI